MKYQYVTISSGHIMRGDSDVDLQPHVVPVVERLLHRGRGDVPGLDGRVQYRFDRDPEIAAAALTVSTTYQGMAAPIWTAIFYLDGAAALAAHDELFKMASRLAVPQENFRGLAAPGLATLLLPGAAVARHDDVFILADFGKTMFMVWALQELSGSGEKPPAVQ